MTNQADFDKLLNNIKDIFQSIDHQNLHGFGNMFNSTIFNNSNNGTSYGNSYGNSPGSIGNSYGNSIGNSYGNSIGNSHVRPGSSPGSNGFFGRSTSNIKSKKTVYEVSDVPKLIDTLFPELQNKYFSWPKENEKKIKGIYDAIKKAAMELLVKIIKSTPSKQIEVSVKKSLFSSTYKDLVKEIAKNTNNKYYTNLTEPNVKTTNEMLNNETKDLKDKIDEVTTDFNLEINKNIQDQKKKGVFSRLSSSLKKRLPLLKFDNCEYSDNFFMFLWWIGQLYTTLYNYKGINNTEIDNITINIHGTDLTGKDIIEYFTTLILDSLTKINKGIKGEESPEQTEDESGEKEKDHEAGGEDEDEAGDEGETGKSIFEKLEGEAEKNIEDSFDNTKPFFLTKNIQTNLESGRYIQYNKDGSKIETIFFTKGEGANEDVWKNEPDVDTPKDSTSSPMTSTTLKINYDDKNIIYQKYHEGTVVGGSKNKHKKINKHKKKFTIKKSYKKGKFLTRKKKYKKSKFITRNKKNRIIINTLKKKI
jgi:hypothetical protein